VGQFSYGLTSLLHQSAHRNLKSSTCSYGYMTGHQEPIPVTTKHKEKVLALNIYGAGHTTFKLHTW
jgi:hypothetical protein